MTINIRWKQRFEHFILAILQLEEALLAYANHPTNTLYPMAIIQSFEFTYELSWKTLKDYLTLNGVQTSLPKETIKLAFKHELIDNGQEWINMLEDRNLLAHTYSSQASKDAIQRIASIYIGQLRHFKTTFEKRYAED